MFRSREDIDILAAKALRHVVNKSSQPDRALCCLFFDGFIKRNVLLLREILDRGVDCILGEHRVTSTDGCEGSRCTAGYDAALQARKQGRVLALDSLEQWSLTGGRQSSWAISVFLSL